MSWMLRVRSGAEGGEESAFILTPVARKRAWKTVALDGAGRACCRARLLEDGQVLLATGVMAMAYETADGQTCRRDEVVACDAAGQPLPLLASTRERPQPLEPVKPEELLEYVATAIYAAAPQRLDRELEMALRQGHIFRTRFRPRATVHDRPAFLLAGGDGIFVLLGERLEFAPCVREAPLPPEDEVDEEWDEGWDDEDIWMSTESLSSVGTLAQSQDDNPWATAPGEEAY